jgi:glyoxylase-like metal-dependent hydrolase (beta-lactamase superfamily II)
MSAPARSRRIGDFEVIAVGDGILNSGLGSLIGVEPAEVERLAGISLKTVLPLQVTSFVVRHNGKLALIDAGSGNSMGPTLGKLPENLRAAGIAPERIDHVLLTHIHPDHSNGLIDADGKAVFANAEIVVSEADAKFWLETDPETEQNEFRQRNMRAARRAFAPYGERVRRVVSGEALPGLSAHPQPGHTLGHTGWLVASRGQSLLVWGDIVHVSKVQFARPEAAVSFDLDPEQARKSRARVFDWVATDRIEVAGAHLDLPSFGTVTRKGTGFAFEASA